MRTLTLTAVLVLLPTYACCADLNARDIVTQSIANYEKDWKAALEFTYTEQDAAKDSSGKMKTSEVSQVLVIDGTPYSRLIARNSRPLGKEEARKEEEKYRTAVSTRDSETPAQRAHRRAKYENERRFLREIPNAFNLKLLGHETLVGRANYVIGLTPKGGYVAKDKNARMFKDIEGKLWVDEKDLRWTKAAANVIQPISIGWVLARVASGSHITMTQVKVDSEHWMPKEIDVNGSARIVLVKSKTFDQTMSYGDYKFTGGHAAAGAAKNP